MENPMLSNEIHGDKIRKEEIDGEIFYSVIDIVAELLNFEYKKAQHYYHVVKGRLKKEGSEFPDLRHIKAKARDNKYYLTDFISERGIESLLARIESSRYKKHIRVNVRKDDEVIVFHQEIIKLLSQDWLIEHHVPLSSGATIDILASSKGNPEEIMLIECKPYLSRQKFYAAIGQVFSYQAEFGRPVIPAIAAYSTHISAYMRDICEKLRVRLIAI